MATVNMEPTPATDDAQTEDSAVAEPRAGGPCAAGPELVRRHQEEIWWYLRFLGCQEAEASDLAQETFLAVLKKPPEDFGPAAVRVYLRKIARSKLLESLRKNRRAAAFDLDAAEATWAATQTGSSDGNGGGNGEDAWLDALDDCLQTLEGRAKQVVDMTYRESRSRNEIAVALEMTESGVKSLLRRSREVLRQCVERKVKASDD